MNVVYLCKHLQNRGVNKSKSLCVDFMSLSEREAEQTASNKLTPCATKIPKAKSSCLKINRKGANKCRGCA